MKLGHLKLALNTICEKMCVMKLTILIEHSF